MDLEKRLPAGVHILMLAPSLAGNHVEVKMRVGALSDKSKIEFLKALESAPEFSRLELLSESRSGRAEERDVVQLDLTADYHPVAGPAGRKPEQSGGAE